VTMLDPRAAVVVVARACVGWTRPDPRLGALVAPTDTPERQIAIEAESLCMLTALGIEEAALEVEREPGPYRNGSAPQQLERRAGGTPWHPGGAIRVPTLAEPPDYGDAVWYGPGPGGPEHVEHVVEASEVVGGVVVLTCVAGGERDAAGAETVKLVRRLLTWRGTRWLDLATGRPAEAVIDAALLGGMYPPREVAEPDS
jgi:hypothetical protein